MHFYVKGSKCSFNSSGLVREADGSLLSRLSQPSFLELAGSALSGKWLSMSVPLRLAEPEQEGSVASNSVGPKRGVSNYSPGWRGAPGRSPMTAAEVRKSACWGVLGPPSWG